MCNDHNNLYSNSRTVAKMSEMDTAWCTLCSKNLILNERSQRWVYHLPDQIDFPFVGVSYCQHVKS